MVAANLSDSSETTRYGAGERPRRPALLLAVLLHLLIGLIFAYQKREPLAKMGEEGLKTFNIAPEGPKGSETEKSEPQQQKTQAKQAASQVAPVPAETPPPPDAPPPVVRDFQMPFLQLNSQDYAASNIGKQASQRPSANALAQGDSKAPQGPGSGPGGATLYPADWYREPTDAELGGYLKPDMPRQGWGAIACKTVAQYHVDDCYILGESPRGSGFARSVLNASWQFLVMPPRINGKAQVGTWVSIRITYYDGSIRTGPG